MPDEIPPDVQLMSAEFMQQHLAPAVMKLAEAVKRVADEKERLKTPWHVRQWNAVFGKPQ